MNATYDFHAPGLTAAVTGSEDWYDTDDGVTRTTLTILATRPDGSTFGYFARDLDAAAAALRAYAALGSCKINLKIGVDA
jgi:hypothetical protein